MTLFSAITVVANTVLENRILQWGRKITQRIYRVLEGFSALGSLINFSETEQGLPLLGLNSTSTNSESSEEDCKDVIGR
jgi:hypothetical protein